MTRKAIVTGGAGFVGSHLTEVLLDRDWEVRVVDALSSGKVLGAAQRSGARKVCFASSGGAVYGEGARMPVRETAVKNPASPYGISKKIVEDYFRWSREVYGLEYSLLALANVYGPRQDAALEGGVIAIFAKAMLEGRRPV